MQNYQILTINSGSSSIKFALFEAGKTLGKNMYGVLGNLNSLAYLKVMNANGEIINNKQFAEQNTYKYYFELLFSHLSDAKMNVQAIGHRVVHGGMHYKMPVVVNNNVIDELKAFNPFAPLHQPYNIEAIEIIAKLFPDMKQIACFDTAFHRTHDKIADYFGIPRNYTESGVRRYGFHGLSYEYITSRYLEKSPDNVHKKIIIAHLGNGASLCAVKDGKSVDSTMGFTALDGLMMGTRCGALDPGVVLYFMQQHKMSPKEIETLLYKQSGLLGVSQMSSNMQELLQSDRVEAKEAVDLFVYRIKKEIGALCSTLGGIDTLIFTGGIGENAAFVRKKVCENMQWLGMSIDDKLNVNNNEIISSVQSKVEILVTPTDEEFVIANHTNTLLQGDNHG